MNEQDLSLRLQGMAGVLARALEEIMGEPYGFVLVLSRFGNPGEKTEAQYIANVKREDGTRMLNQLRARWETGLPDIPLHKQH